jgi:hypothetical protein
MNDAQTVRSITGSGTGTGVEATLNLEVDGSVAAASVAVPTDTRVYISDVMLGGLNASTWRLQQTNDGVTWFDIALWEVPAASLTATRIYSYTTGLLINGGPPVVQGDLEVIFLTKT